MCFALFSGFVQIQARAVILRHVVQRKHSRSAAHRNCTLLLNVKLSMCARVSVPVAVGYEYEVCPGVIHWERRTALMQGFELVPSDLGGWSLDKHHALNIRSGEFIRLFLVLGGWLRF